MEIDWGMVADVFWGVQMLVGLVCVIFLILILNNSETADDRGIIKTVIAYLSFNLLLWLIGVVFLNYQAAYVILGPLMLFSFIICPVLLYRIVCQVTYTDTRKQFSTWHYMAPVMLTLLWTAVTQVIPFDARVAITENFNRPSPDYPILTHYFTSMVPHTLVFQMIYIPLSLFRLHSYRRSAEGNSRKYRLVWVQTLIVLSMMKAMRAFIALINVERSIYVASWNLILGCVILIGMVVVLTVNVLRRNYPSRKVLPVIPRKPLKTNGIPAQTDDSLSGEEVVETVYKVALTKKEFDTFFRNEKPYLDPELTLVTLAKRIGTNRVILSTFINKRYGVNFNVYVNRWRVMEVKKLSKLARNQNKPLKDMIKQAGFGSYYSYRRAMMDEGKEEINGK